MRIATIGAYELRPYYLKRALKVLSSQRALWLLLFIVLLSSLHLGALGESPAKIESSLVELAALAEQGQLLRAQDLARQRGINLQDDDLTVIIEPQGGLSARIDLPSLSAQGATIEARSPDLLRVRLPLARLRQMANGVSGIAFIRRPYRWAPLGEITLSQGPLPTGGLLFQSRGFKGQGVKVAIIDAGFSGLYLAVKRHILSSEAVAFSRDYTGKGLLAGSEHGTAVAEIVHEMAPQAQLYLLKIGDEVDLENAVNDAIQMGVRVINHSLGWFDTDFGDGKGMVNEIVRRARAQGILWINAAGNQAQAHWLGRFRDDDHDGWAEFSLGQEALALQAPLGGLIDLVLVWNDWPMTDQDYDLFLTDGQGKVLASSEDRQTGTQPPREEVQYVADHPGIYYAKVRARWTARPMWLRLFQIESGATFLVPTPHGSLVAPADCTCALAVAAVNVERWASANGPQEPFSALGPTFDGRTKPDITGPDGVDNLFFSGRLGGFLGTSAAAPHVAGAAALLLSEHPDWSITQVDAALREDATDLGPAGPDIIYGAGLLDLILAWPGAERHIVFHGSHGTPLSVRPGERLSVSLTVQMPLSRFGSLRLREALPTGFRLHPVDNAGAAYDAEQVEWDWSNVDPGRSIRILYALEIAPDEPSGAYRLQGTINGRPVGGDALVQVNNPSMDSPYHPVEPLLSSMGVSWAVPLKRETGETWYLQVFDMSGRMVFISRAEEGSRRLLWPLVDAQGLPVANGVYLYRIERHTADGRASGSALKKIAVLRR